MSGYLPVPMTEEVPQQPVQTARFQLLAKICNIVRLTAIVPFLVGLLFSPSGKWSAALSFAGYCNVITYFVMMFLSWSRYMTNNLRHLNKFKPSSLYLVIEAIMMTLCISAATVGVLYGNERQGCLNQSAGSDTKPKVCLKVPISVYWSLSNGLLWAILFVLDLALTYMYKSESDDIEADIQDLFVIGDCHEIEIGEYTGPNQNEDASETENLIEETANQRD